MSEGNEPNGDVTPNGDPQANPTLTTEPKPEPTPTDPPKANDADPKPGDEPKPSAEPLKAEDIVIPEGFEVDEGLRDKFLEVANKHGLSKEVAADLVKLQSEAAEAFSARGNELWQQTQEQWQTDARNDPEIGGTKLDENLATCARLLDKFGNDKLREAFDLTGIGNHPEMIRFLAKVGANFREGSLITGDPGASGQSVAARLYPSMNKG